MFRRLTEKSTLYCRAALSLIFLLGILSSSQADPVTIPQQAEQGPHAVYARGYNATFESTPAEGFDWSGGDYGVSVKLPDCPKCLPAEQENRRLWFFGDTFLSYVGKDGLRYKDAPPHQNAGTLKIYGNSIAITHHPDNSPPGRADVFFDWGDAFLTRVAQAWVPMAQSFIANSGRLPDMHPMRAAINGYSDMGFGPASPEDVWVYDSPSVLDDPNDPSTLVKRDDLAPVYEYYFGQPGQEHSYYSNKYDTSGVRGLQYRGVAFYVLKKPAPGAIALYRHFSRSINDVMLSTNPDIGAHGFRNQGSLGYVYTTSSRPSDQHEVQLHSHLRVLDPLNVHRKYTTRPNDGGFELYNWPLNGVAIDNDLILTNIPVHSVGGGQFDFLNPTLFSIIKEVNLPIGEWGKLTPGAWVTQKPSQHVPLAYSDIRWGAGFVKHVDFASNRILYIYGTRDASDIPSLPPNARRLYLARVVATSATDVMDSSNWEFYDGSSSWSGFYGDAEPIVVNRGDNGVVLEQSFFSGTQAVTVIPGPSDNWVMSLTNSIVLSPEASIAAAPDVTGPWTVVADFNIRDVLVHEDEKNDNLKYYTIALHEDLALNGAQNGLLLSFTRSCSFSRNPETCNNDVNPDFYIQGFMSIPWEDIFTTP